MAVEPALASEDSSDTGNLSMEQRFESCCLRQHYRMRKIKSNGALLVLVWCFFVYCPFLITLSSFLPIPLNKLPVFLAATLPGMVSSLINAFSFPFAGWLADVHFGRYKLMRTGLWMMWGASILGTVGQTVQYSEPSAANGIRYGLFLVVFLLINAGFSCFIVNAIPLATDQLLEAGGSADEASAFIHWYVWSLFAGCVPMIAWSFIAAASEVSFNVLSLISSIIAVVMLSAALCADSLLSHWLTVQPKSRNPWMTIYEVLHYAGTHKYPAMRSALTYWEEKIPSRIDLGKSKYGGPFTVEQVEDVKTFLRIVVLVVVSTIGGFLLPYAAFFVVPIFESHFENFGRSKYNAGGFSFAIPVILGIPVYELLIHPLAGKWTPNMLRRFGIGTSLTLFFSLYMVILIAVGQSTAGNSVPCIITANQTSPPLKIDYLWADIPYNILFGIQLMIFFVSQSEFIVAQAPHNMKGMLIGFAWAINALSVALGELIPVIWYLAWTEPITVPSCGVWYYVSTAVLGAAALLLVSAVSRWYRKRMRDEPSYEQGLVESVYGRYTARQPPDFSDSLQSSCSVSVPV